MSQATIERPAARKTAGKPADRAVDSREKIILQFSLLLNGICATVESEEADCLGRVFEIAGGLVRRAAGEFAASDSDASYQTMLDADSLIQAAAALAVYENAPKEWIGKRGAPGRDVEARRLADLSDAITNAQDQRLTDIAAGDASAIVPKTDPAQEEQAPGVSLTVEAARLVSNCTYQIETCVLMMQDMARRSGDETTGVDLEIVVQALGVRIEQLNQCITDTVFPNTTGPSLDEVRDKVEGQSPRLMEIKQPA